MEIDVSRMWAWLQTLPFWAIFSIIAAIAALVLLPEFVIRAWDRKRIQRCQRQWMEYNQCVREYHKHYKDAKHAAHYDWLEWQEGFRSQNGALPSPYLSRLRKWEIERVKLAVIGPEPSPPSG